MNNTFRLNGTYYYLRRIPSDLIQAAAFGYKRNSKNAKDTIRYSLRTKDPREARRRMSIEDAKAEEEFERLRQKIEKSNNSEFLRRRNPAESERRKFSALSAPERRDFIFCLFIELERKTTEAKGRDVNRLDSDNRQEAVAALGTDLAALEGNNPNYIPIDWDSKLQTLLKAKGIDLDDTSSPEFVEMRDKFQRAHVENKWRSFRTLDGDPHNEHDALFKGLCATSDLPSDPLSGSKTISQLCAAYVETSKINLAKATVNKHSQTCDLVKKVFGGSTPVKNITVDKAKSFVELLPTIPVNASKRYKYLSLKKATAKESKKDNPNFLASKTQKNLFEGVKAIFNYAYDMEWVETNPFGKKILSKMLPEVNSKPPTLPNSDDLNALFSAEIYLSERKNGNRGQARFWVPLLCLFHGFRANEVCQLLVSDIQESEDIHFINLSEQDDKGNIVKQLKNSSSQRKVPIHKDVLKMGFLEFVQEQETAGETSLFSSLKMSKNGEKASTVGKWFGRIKKSIFEDVPPIRGAKGIHSLRHAFVRACRNAEVGESLRWALGGWSGEGRNSEADYGDGYSMTTLKQAIDKVHYKDVDLSHLYPPKNKAVRKRTRK